MKKMEECIHKYEEQGRAIINALEDRGALKGWYKTLSDLYPDNAHFIFELLQNAEDAGATKVEFKLSGNDLIFLHNGTRAFSEDDINSITNIGDSNKSTNKIGKFGVGFKSVFTYTETPKIHSESVSFQIQNLIIPSTINKETIDCDYTTLFIFPFNRENKTKEIAYKEISNLFNELDDNVLLFLKNISEIVWSFKGGERHSLARKIDHNITKIINSSKGSSYWLVFKKYTHINNSKFETSVAYSYNKEEEKINRIKGDVSIFFPAKKEFSRLGFHINAPFSSTVARDSITDVNENKKLLLCIAELCAESVHIIKKIGLLKMSFFEVLPNEDDELSYFYKPVYDKLLQEFNDSENELIPLKNDGFSNIENCVFSSKLLKDTFLDNDLNIIFDSNSIIGFAKNSLKGSRGDKFISKLRMDFIDDSYVHDKLQELSDEVSQYNLDNYCNEDYEIKRCHDKRKWLRSKTNEQLQAIYSFIYESRKYDYITNFFLPIIKLSNGSFNFNNEDVYFPETDNTYSDFLFVERATYLSGKSQKQQGQSKMFLEALGVKELGESVHLELLFENYEFKSEESHLQDMGKLVNFYIVNGKNIDKRFSFFEFVYTSEKILTSPLNTYVDNPYLDTGMNSVAEILELHGLNDIYTQLDDIEDFVSLLISIGAREELKVERRAISSNHPERVNLIYYAKGKRYTSTGMNEDWTIDNIDNLLKKSNESIAISVLIWNAINNAGAGVFNAIYRNNSSHPKQIGKSYLVHALSRDNWIYDNVGVVHNPKDVNKDSLNTVYSQDKNGWLEEIGFGENIYKKTKEFDQKNEILQEFNLDYDAANEIKKFTSDEIKDFIDIVKEGRQRQKLSDVLKKRRNAEESSEFIKVNIDKSLIVDSDEYQRQVSRENQLNNTSFTVKSKLISKQDDKNIQLIKEFLYEQYDGHCQICGDTFSYKGRNFFIDFSLNRGKKRDINRKGNTLCLCPKHHQIFTLGIQHDVYVDNMPRHIDTNTMKDLFLYKEFVGKIDISNKNDGFYMSPDNSFEIDAVYMAPVRLFNEVLYIKFTEMHATEFADTWNNF